MSSVLHPVGPEEPRTYWLRRALVLVAVLAVVALIVVVGVNAAGGERSAVPQASPSPSQQQSQRPPSASTSASPSPSVTSPTPSPTPTRTKSPSPSPKPTKTPPPSCDPDDLRATLTGKRKFKAKEDLTFNLSLINGGARSCVVEVTADTFELKVTSGNDRIWSTADCAKSVKSIKQTIGPEKAVEWQLTWDGKRSVKGCKTRPEVPRPGTYIATAHLDGAKQVKLGMTLVD